jgi:lipid-binding SYLF domain-containing protein
MTRRPVARRAVLAVLLLAAAAPVAAADPATKSDQLVREALVSLRNFFHDPDSAGFRDKVRSARGVLIVPHEGKGGFIFAGSGGAGVLVARDPENESEWRGPVFYRLGSISVGPQAGGARSEVVYLLMTDRAVDALLSPEAKFGGEVSVAAGPIGGGSGAATTDVLSYMRSKGAFLGGALVASSIRPHGKLNAGYYGEELSPVDVLVRRKGTRKADADQLVLEIDRAASQ